MIEKMYASELSLKHQSLKNIDLAKKKVELKKTISL